MTMTKDQEVTLQRMALWATELNKRGLKPLLLIAGNPKDPATMTVLAANIDQELAKVILASVTKTIENPENVIEQIVHF